MSAAMAPQQAARSPRLCDSCATPLLLAGANAMLVGRCAPCVKRIALAAKAATQPVALMAPAIPAYVAAPIALPTYLTPGRAPYLLGTERNGTRSFSVLAKAGVAIVTVAHGGALDVEEGELTRRELAAFEEWLEVYDAETAWDDAEERQATRDAASEPLWQTLGGGL